MRQFSPRPCPCCTPIDSGTPIETLQLAIALVLGFSVVEWLTGQFSHSLSLLADSGHMLTDAIALSLALWATWRARQGHPGGRRESGVAIVNGLSLLVMAGLVLWEALRHLNHPPEELLSLPVLGVALLGLLINTSSAKLLHQGSQSNLNLEGAFLHAVADAMGSVGVIVAALVAYLWGWHWVDTAIGMAIASFITISAIPLLIKAIAQWQTPVKAVQDTPGLLELGQAALIREPESTSPQPRRSPSTASNSYSCQYLKPQLQHGPIGPLRRKGNVKIR
ncbi:cation transporter [Geitlerinema sp. P-1104]|uniref:cation diffusion facilitator family transporter n=1 Tax=Geitlerinema sp. P-1104 TaxID=2546230 RepID=UPI0014772F63|nr:cation diffusion facilitator family transporter [Geitlerinema sp. P-1104]NMG59310.1 cation transporter [Geitlerinema sp. P-1104]